MDYSPWFFSSPDNEGEELRSGHEIKYTAKNKTVPLTQLGLSQLQLLNQHMLDQYIDSVVLDSKQLATHGHMLSQLQVHYQTMCIQADQLHCLTSIGSPISDRKVNN